MITVFKFSAAKTCIVHFTDSNRLFNSPDLYLNNDLLPYRANTKFLGLTWDSKLTWRPHINQLRGQGFKLLDFLCNGIIFDNFQLVGNLLCSIDRFMI